MEKDVVALLENRQVHFERTEDTLMVSQTLDLSRLAVGMLDVDFFKGVNLKVRGFLNLTEQGKISTLGGNLVIEYGLNLTGCISLTRLPCYLHLGGNLNLKKCHAFNFELKDPSASVENCQVLSSALLVAPDGKNYPMGLFRHGVSLVNGKVSVVSPDFDAISRFYTHTSIMPSVRENILELFDEQDRIKIFSAHVIKEAFLEDYSIEVLRTTTRPLGMRSHLHWTRIICQRTGKVFLRPLPALRARSARDAAAFQLGIKARDFSEFGLRGIDKLFAQSG